MVEAAVFSIELKSRQWREKSRHEWKPGRCEALGRVAPLNALRAFDAVARHGSFARAAVELHVTHWAVGKQIRLLEDWFGLPLFDRRPRGVVLTDEGAALLNDVSHAFERLGTAVVRLRHDTFTHRISGVVRVNVPMSFALCWLPPRLADFHSRYPEIDVRVSTTSRKLRYVADAFDIGVRSGPEQGAGVVSRPLMPDLRVPVLQSRIAAPASDTERGRPAPSRPAAFGHDALCLVALVAGSRSIRSAGRAPCRIRSCESAARRGHRGARRGPGIPAADRARSRRGRLVCPIASPVWRADDYMLVTNADRADDAAVSAFEEWMEGMASREAG